MKKSNIKKLTISKETVSQLNNLEMSHAKGGYATASCPIWGCNTNEAVCTTGCFNTEFC